jgi:hypothetical protein
MKIIIVPTLLKSKEAISLAKALHNKHGCEVLIAVHNSELMQFNLLNCGIQTIPFNSLSDIEYQLVVNNFTICITFFNDHEAKDSNIFSFKVRKVSNGEYTFESKKGIIKTKVKDNDFVEDENKDIPLLTTIYKNAYPTYVYNDENKQIILRGQIDSGERLPIFNYKIKQYNTSGHIIIKPLCNWEKSVDMFNDFKRFSKDGKGKWNNILLDPTSTSPDYYLVLNSTKEAFDPLKTIWFCMEPKMETHPAWENFCRIMNNANPVYNGSHSLQMNNVEWHLNKTYTELLTYNIEKKHDKVLSIVVSDRCVDEGHKLRLDFIKDLDERASSTSLFGLKSNNTLGFEVHIYGKCASLKFKNYKGELPKASKDDGILPYKYHFNAENHSYDNYVTEKFTDGIVGETVFFYWGCPNIDKYYNKDSFIRLSLKREDREKDIEIVKNAILNNEWSKRIDTIRKEKNKMVKVYNLFPRMETILFLKDTTLLVEPLGEEDTKVRVDYLIKQNFKDIQMVTVNKGMKVFLDIFNLSVQSNKNVLMLFNVTSVIDIHHNLTVSISEARELEGKVPEIILLDDESFMVTPAGAKAMLEEIDKVFKSGVGITFEGLYKKFFYKKLK